MLPSERFMVCAVSPEVISCGLTGHIGISEANKVLSSLLGGTKVDFSTFIDDKNLVELLVDTFTSLVKGDEACSLEHIGENAERLGIVQGGGGIETLGCIVPGGNSRACRHHLGDRDSLALSTRDTSNFGITDEGILRVRNVQHAQEQVSDFVSELFNALSWQSLARCL